MLRTFRLENSAWDFFDIEFLSRNFLGGVSVGSPRDFFDFCHHLIISVT